MSGMTSLKSQLSDGITSIVKTFSSKKQLKVSAQMVDSQSADNWEDLKQYMYGAVLVRKSAFEQIGQVYGVSFTAPIDEADFDELREKFTLAINHLHEIKDEGGKAQLGKFLALLIITNRIGKIDDSKINGVQKNLIAKQIEGLLTLKTETTSLKRSPPAGVYTNIALDDYVTKEIMVKEMAGGFLSKKNPLRVAAGAAAENFTGFVTGNKSIKHQLFDAVKGTFGLTEIAADKLSGLVNVKGEGFTANRQLVRNVLDQIFLNPDVAVIIFAGNKSKKTWLGGEKLSEEQVATLQKLLQDEYIVGEFKRLLREIMGQLADLPELTGDKKKIVELAIKKLFANQNLVAKITEIVGGKTTTAGVALDAAGDAAFVGAKNQLKKDMAGVVVEPLKPSPDRKPVTFTPSSVSNTSSSVSNRVAQVQQTNTNSQGVPAPKLPPRPGDKKT